MSKSRNKDSDSDDFQLEKKKKYNKSFQGLILSDNEVKYKKEN